MNQVLHWGPYNLDSRPHPDCPDNDALRAFIAGSLSPESATRLRVHVRECARCRAREAQELIPTAVLSAPAVAAMPAAAERPPAMERTGAGEGAAAEPLPRGTLIGRYILVDQLGAGGMGVVYAAYDPELDRRVAIKLLRPSARALRNGGQARLLREAQAMARLSHPNVVPVHDVGAYGDGIFVAMELVDGQSLRGWLKGGPRPWREVVERFVAAGRGLAAAHAAGLVHRDFKPDNVLVGRDGRVRVMDFGLARQVNGPSGGFSQETLEPLSPASGPVFLTSPLTQAGLVLGTPSYMAPEQFRRQPTDARSDQFSFCVALYEGLYGERPFPSRLPPLEGEGWWEVPAPPRSSRVPSRVRRAVVRGLSASPEERFPTMEALLAALERDPHVRRRRWLAGAGAVTLVGLTAGLPWQGVAARQASLCRGAERKLAGVWDAARKRALEHAFIATGVPVAAATWERVQRTVDAYANAWASMHTEACEASRVRGEQSDEVLSLRMACLDRRLEELRALTDVFAAADRELVMQAVRAAHALAGLEGCANVEALRAPMPPPQDADTAAKVQALRTRLAEVKALASAGKYKQGLELATAAAAEARALRYLPLEAESLALLGELQESSGDMKAAEQSLTEAVWAAQAGRHDEAGATAASLLVWVSMQMARAEQGHQWGRYARATLARMGGDVRAESSLMMSLGGLLLRESRYDEAVEHFQRALALREQLEEAAQPQVATVLNNIAAARLEQGRTEEAREHLQRALDIYEKALGPEHPSTARSLFNFGNALLASAEDAKALETYRRARPVLEQTLSPHHPIRAEILISSGTAHLNLGNHAEAVRHFREGMAAHERAFGPQHPAVARPMLSLATVAHLQGDLEGALAQVRRAVAIQEGFPGTTPVELATGLLSEGEVLQSLGQVSEARARYQRALALFEKTAGPRSLSYAQALESLGSLLLAQGRGQQAQEHFERALAIREAALRPDHPDLERGLSGLGRSHLAQGAPARAVGLLERALRLCGSRRIPPHHAAQTRLALARALWEAQGDRARARELAVQAREGFAQSRRRAERAQVESWLATHTPR